MLETSFIINRKANKILLYIKIIFINLSFIKLIKYIYKIIDCIDFYKL